VLRSTDAAMLDDCVTALVAALDAAGREAVIDGI
jgi:hypothetical protein